MKLEKGQPGYIKARKLRYLMLAVAEFAIVAAVFILGYMQTGSRMNLFTVAKMLVEFITMAPYKSIDPEKYKELEEKAGLLTRAYDLIITSTEKVMSVEAVVISGHVVCGFTSNPKTDETILARYIKTTLKNQRYDKMTVKIFHDYQAFLARVEGMGNIAAVQKPDKRRDQAVRKILYSISM